MKKILYLLTLTLFVFTSCEQDQEIIDVTTDTAIVNKKPVKIPICHYNPHNDTYKTMYVNEKQLQKYLDQGDKRGACGYTYVPDDNFEQALIDLGYDDVLDDYVITSNISEAITLDVSSKNINNLTGIEDFTNLILLNCNRNQLTNLNVIQNTKLIELYCHTNQFIDLDVSKNTKLTNLSCGSNKLTSLDVSKNISLESFWCGNNQLTSLDVSKNINLVSLTCRVNKLSSLDISANTELKELRCHTNLLSSLDLSQHNLLTYLESYNCQLKDLNLRNGNNSSIELIRVTDNPLLSCIQVDNVEDANGYLSWYKDGTSNYSVDCGL